MNLQYLRPDTIQKKPEEVKAVINYLPRKPYAPSKKPELPFSKEKAILPKEIYLLSDD